MKIVLDPYMLRHRSLTEVVKIAAETGYDGIELSPREDFIPFFVRPRADSARIAELKKALRDHGIQLATILPLYKWAGPDEDDRTAAVRYWKRAIEIAVELGVTTMNSEFNGRPEQKARSEAAFWRSMEELLPTFEKEGITLHLEPHPDDFVENGNTAVDMVRGINSPMVKYLYCAPHTFHMGDDVAAMIRYAAPVLAHVHVADTYNHKASSGLRYILNPPGTPARVHQHTNIGEGEVDWDAFFGTLAEVGFDGIMTSCVFAWEEKAVESAQLMRVKIGEYLAKYPSR
jgi:myo-inositol catabolism protein IolH